MLKNINLIAAVGSRGQIGKGGALPWHDREDLAWFRSLTMGGAVVVGWRTYQTLPKLDGRIVLIDDTLKTPEANLSNFEKAELPIWIAGGTRTYERYLPFCKRLHIGRVDYDGPADAFMPPLWKEAA